MIFLCYRYEFVCDDCHVVSNFNNKKSARLSGWSISHLRFENANLCADLCGRRCWCPNCAVNHRRGRPRKISH